MRRSIPTLLLISAAIALTACGEYSTTEPLSGAKNAGLAPSFAGYAVTGDCDPTVDPNCPASAAIAPIQDGGTVTFTPAGGTIHFGTQFTLTYRQNSVSICDAGGTGCEAITGPVTGTAHFGTQAGPLSIDITLDPKYGTDKHLYFSTPGAKLSTSYNAAAWASIVKSGRGLGLVYAPTYGSPNEPNAPRSHFDVATGSLWRWVSHFSGYAVTGDCDPNVDPSCTSPATN